jgi:hypothetical protein
MTLPLEKVVEFSHKLGEIAIAELVKIAVPKTLEEAKLGLSYFADSIKAGPEGRNRNQLPSASLLGLGRCGTNICTQVAQQLERALPTNQQGSTPPVEENQKGVLDRVRKYFGLQDVTRHLYLFEPVILLADADHRLAQADALSPDTLIVPGYERCRRIDLEWLFKNGCGNVPQVGQFLARVLLRRPISLERNESPNGEQNQKDNQKFTDWNTARAFLLDTVGLSENPSRLMISVFSTGGGTGPGLSLELGSAQKYLMIKRAIDCATSSKHDTPEHLESSFSLGLGVMPATGELSPSMEHSDRTPLEERPEAQSLNTGRSIVAYLARLQRYRRVDENHQISEVDVPPFDCQLLVSNGIMTPMAADPKTPFADAAHSANVYISQHLFNLLLAQSLPSDYARDKRQDEASTKLLDALKEGGIEGGELGSLDPGDLKNSLYGLSLVAYAQSKKIQDLDMEELIIKAISPPSWNPETRSIDGISVLPDNDYAQNFIASTGGDPKPGDVVRNLTTKVPLFRKALSVVTVISVPRSREGILKAHQVRILKATISRLFPRASIRRYVVVPDASEIVTLGLLICGNAYMSSEVLHHVYGYALNSFCVPGREDGFIQQIESYLLEGSADKGKAVGQCLLERENLGSILVGLGDPGSFLQRRLELEARGTSILADRWQFDDVLLTSQDLMDALDFMRDGISYGGLRRSNTQTLLSRIPQ